METKKLITYLILYLSLGIFLGFKWKKTHTNNPHNSNDPDTIGGIWIVSILFAPLVLLITFIRQIIVEKWK